MSINLIDEIQLVIFIKASLFTRLKIKLKFYIFEILNKSDFLKIIKLHNLPDPSVESDVGEPEGPDPDEAEEGLVLVE